MDKNRITTLNTEERQTEKNITSQDKINSTPDINNTSKLDKNFQAEDNP